MEEIKHRLRRGGYESAHRQLKGALVSVDIKSVQLEDVEAFCWQELVISLMNVGWGQYPTGR